MTWLLASQDPLLVVSVACTQFVFDPNPVTGDLNHEGAAFEYSTLEGWKPLEIKLRTASLSETGSRLVKSSPPGPTTEMGIAGASRRDMQEAATTTNNSHKRKADVSQTEVPSSFQFVKANPHSESERRQVRTLVRANASNFHWRQVKKADVRSNTDRPLLQPSQAAATASESSAAESTAHGMGSQLDESEAVVVDDDQAHFGAVVPIRRKQSSLTRVTGRLAGSASSPLLSLGVGHVDPFEVYPSELPKHVVSSLLDQVFQFLPQMFPPEQGSFQSSIAQVWFRKCVSERALFHAFLSCQLAKTQASKGPRSKQDVPELLVACRSEAVREIHKKFQKPSTACVDDNILAVMALMYSGEVLTEVPPRSPCQGPLTALQALDIYGGRLDIVAVHAAGLATMLSLRGGLADIKLPGVAPWISYGDIMTASRTLKKPLLPFVSINPDVETHLSSVRRQGHPLCNLGKGFVVLLRILPPEKVTHLYPVLCRLCNYTIAVYDYVEGRYGAQSLGVIADERNFVQHCLMSLTPDEEVAGVEQECPLYELCRLSAIIYSLAIVFPLPATTAPFAKLARQAGKQMLKPTVHARWNEAPQLMFWITAMTAIASIGSSERSWFVSILDRLIRRLKMDSWAEMKEHLQNFLWFGSINDVDGLDLWKEVEHSSPFSL